MKAKDVVTISVIFAVALLVTVGMLVFGGPSEASVTGKIVDAETGEAVGPWSNTIVKYKISTKNEYNGSAVASTAKVYAEEPADWGNPRGDFDEAQLYTQYTASEGLVTIDEEKPGQYYVVLTASGYNTEFKEIEIPDGSSRNIDVADYNSAPDQIAVPMALVGATTDEDFAFTLVNDTSAEVNDIVNPQVNDDTKLIAWKAIIDDTEGFSLDTDGDGDYDEGVSMYKVCIENVCEVIFEPDKGIDKFDSNDEFTMDLTGIEVADGDQFVIKVEIEAATGDYTGVNDEVWGEGEAVLSQIMVYDQEGNLFTTTDVTA